MEMLIGLAILAVMLLAAWLTSPTVLGKLKDNKFLQDAKLDTMAAAWAETAVRAAEQWAVGKLRTYQETGKDRTLLESSTIGDVLEGGLFVVDEIAAEDGSANSAKLLKVRAEQKKNYALHVLYERFPGLAKNQVDALIESAVSDLIDNQIAESGDALADIDDEGSK